ncbi:hypothetical protein V8C86DRAFT_1381989 [Haematococcus lacustris]
MPQAPSYPPANPANQLPHPRLQAARPCTDMKLDLPMRKRHANKRWQPSPPKHMRPQPVKQQRDSSPTRKQADRQAAPEPPNSNSRAHHRNPREHFCDACMRGCDACLADAMRDHSHTHTLHAACVLLPLHVRVAWFACLARVRRMCRGPHLPGAVRRCKAGTQPSFSVVHSRPGGAPPVAAAAGQHRQQAVQSLLPSLCRRHHHTRPPTLPTSCPTPDCRQPGHAQT